MLEDAGSGEILANVSVSGPCQSFGTMHQASGGPSRTQRTSISPENQNRPVTESEDSYKENIPPVGYRPSYIVDVNEVDPNLPIDHVQRIPLVDLPLTQRREGVVPMFSQSGFDIENSPLLHQDRPAVDFNFSPGEIPSDFTSGSTSDDAYTSGAATFRYRSSGPTFAIQHNSSDASPTSSGISTPGYPSSHQSTCPTTPDIDSDDDNLIEVHPGDRDEDSITRVISSINVASETPGVAHPEIAFPDNSHATQDELFVEESDQELSSREPLVESLPYSEESTVGSDVPNTSSISNPQTDNQNQDSRASRGAIPKVLSKGRRSSGTNKEDSSSAAEPHERGRQRNRRKHSGSGRHNKGGNRR